MWRDKSGDLLTRPVQVWLGLQREIHANLESIEVSFAPTTFTGEMRKHLEGCLARQLRQKHADTARFYPADNRAIPRKMLELKTSVTAEMPIEGLNPQLEV